MLEFLLIKNLADADDGLVGLEGKLDGCQDDITVVQLSFGGRGVRHGTDLYLAVHDLAQLHADQARGHAACAADDGDAEGTLLPQIVFLQEDTEIGSEMAALVFIDLQPLLALDDTGGDAGHLIGERELGPEFLQHGIGLADLEAQAVHHKHQVIGEFLGKITGVDGDVQLFPDLRHDLFREREDGLIQFHFFHRAQVCRGPHAGYRKESKNLFLYGKLHMQVGTNLV